MTEGLKVRNLMLGGPGSPVLATADIVLGSTVGSLTVRRVRVGGTARGRFLALPAVSVGGTHEELVELTERGRAIVMSAIVRAAEVEPYTDPLDIGRAERPRRSDNAVAASVWRCTADWAAMGRCARHEHGLACLRSAVTPEGTT